MGHKIFEGEKFQGLVINAMWISFGCHGLSHLEQRSARVHNGNVNIWRGNIVVFETRHGLVLSFVRELGIQF